MEGVPHGMSLITLQWSSDGGCASWYGSNYPPVMEGVPHCMGLITLQWWRVCLMVWVGLNCRLIFFCLWIGHRMTTVTVESGWSSARISTSSRTVSGRLSSPWPAREPLRCASLWTVTNSTWSGFPSWSRPARTTEVCTNKVGLLCLRNPQGQFKYSIHVFTCTFSLCWPLVSASANHTR